MSPTETEKGSGSLGTSVVLPCISFCDSVRSNYLHIGFFGVQNATDILGQSPK